ncbi:MAG: primosomal protein N' [Candidatus Omnitrophica bacterium]|nr:primosomal protein N' [Candidatus Omnitrophota bacterium]
MPETKALLIHDLDGQLRWDVYIERIKEVLALKKSVIIILPDVDSVSRVRDRIAEKINAPIGLIYRKAPDELAQWQKARVGEVSIVIGTRSAIFIPLKGLGLIIVEEEDNSVYKQDQVPHYHVRKIALIRCELENADLILGSVSPTLESINLAKSGKLILKQIPRSREFPEIKVIDMKFEGSFSKGKRPFFSKYLMDTVFSSLNAKEKVLFFLNRKGFATYSACHKCGKVMRCPRCNVHLVYHFKENQLICHYCSFKMELPKMCPECNAGYIKFFGSGTEKIESELSRLFPQARIKDIESHSKVDLNEADIFVATSAVFKQEGLRFDLTGILAIDNSLNRIDLRSTEKTFAIMAGLLSITDKKFVIQTTSPLYSCFQALYKKDITSFYDEELKQRHELRFPPFKHFVLVKVRSPKEEKAAESAKALFDKLSAGKQSKGIKVVSVTPAQPAKLRGNYCWQILLSADDPVKVTKFLKLRLKNFKHSGIIITVDVDPV